MNCDSSQTFQKRLLFALAFVPIPRVEEFARLVDAKIIAPELQELKKSYMRTWVGNSALGKRPRYPHSWWNVYERVKNQNGSTTNNYAEADNNLLAQLMGVKNKRPGLWKFLLCLQNAYSHYESKYGEFLRPKPPVKKSSREERRIETIKKAVDAFDERTPEEYLLSIIKATSI